MTSPAPVATDFPLGRTVPRLFTPPNVVGDPGPCECSETAAQRYSKACICRCECGCALTPESSFGFNVIDFATNVLRFPPDPWQRWLLIHAGEMGADGLPRFRYILVLVARQNGKTQLLVILSLYWLFVDMVGLVLGTSSKLDYAKEAWQKAINLARRRPKLYEKIPKKDGIRKTNGEQTLTVLNELEDEDGHYVEECRYKIAAANDDAGRSMTIDRIILDEFRRHFDWLAYDAAIPTMQAVPDAQAWILSNQGDQRSVPLRELRKQALDALEAEDAETDLMLAEWSAPDGADPEDPEALAQANPNIGRRIMWKHVMKQAARVKRTGGAALAGFKIEIMCMEVDSIDPAVNPIAWRECATGSDLSGWRDRLALCFDVSLDGQHAALFAAVFRPDGVAVVDSVKVWTGPGCAQQMARELPGIAQTLKPCAIGWFPGGPAAEVAAAMVKRKRTSSEPQWPPRRCTVEAVRGDAPAACMGFSALVDARQLSHGDDDLLNAHVLSADKLPVGDAWRFVRIGAAHVNAAYAAAGAVHIARSVTPRRGMLVPTSAAERAEQQALESEVDQ